MPNKFRYGFKLEYAVSSLGGELGVILIGNIINTCVFGLLILLAFLLQKLIQHAPKLVYNFVASYGIATVLDSILLFVVDIITWVLSSNSP